jgi:hypothetical protein
VPTDKQPVDIQQITLNLEDSLQRSRSLIARSEKLIAVSRRLKELSMAVALLMGAWLMPMPARAGDFPDDVKRTFTTDIPHFFQDDIPCAFGGKPTSGAKSACKGSGHAATAKAKKHKTPSKKPVPAHTDAANAGASGGAAAGTAPAPNTSP